MPICFFIYRQWYGSLDDFSAFPFENFLGKMKKKVRSGNKPLAQLAARIPHIEQINNMPVKLTGLHSNGPLVGSSSCSQFNRLSKDRLVFDTKVADSFAMDKDGEVLKISNLIRLEDNAIHCVCNYFLKREPFFSNPIDSRLVSIYVVSVASEIQSIPLSHISCKVAAFPFQQSGFVIFPFLSPFWLYFYLLTLKVFFLHEILKYFFSMKEFKKCNIKFFFN